MEEKKKNSSSIIVILVLIIIVLGGYIAYDKLLSKDVSIPSNTPADNIEKNSKEEKNIDLVFNENNIYNKDETYKYSVIDQKDDNGFVQKTETGYVVNDSTYNITYELTNNYKMYLETLIYKGGPGMEEYKVIFLDEEGNIDYLKYEIFESDNNGNVKYGFRLYRINNLKNVKKLYLVKLSSDRPVSPNGQTVVAQTTDGKLYDLFDYVYGDTNLIGSSK